MRTSPRHLLIARHGQTAWNATQRMQGHHETELDERGLAQAEALAAVVAKREPIALWSSDLVRARQTAAAIGIACDLTPTFDGRFREYSLGALQGMTHSEFQERDVVDFAKFKAGDWGAISEIESPSHVAQRWTAGIRAAGESLHAGELGVVVSHGAAIRTGLGALLGFPITKSVEMPALGNCAWAEIAGASGVWTLMSYGLSVEEQTGQHLDFVSVESAG